MKFHWTSTKTMIHDGIYAIWASYWSIPCQQQICSHDFAPQFPHPKWQKPCNLPMETIIQQRQQGQWMRYKQTHNPTNSTEAFLHSNKPTDSLCFLCSHSYLQIKYRISSWYNIYIYIRVMCIYTYTAHWISPVFQCAFRFARPNLCDVGLVPPGDPGLHSQVDVDGWLLHIIAKKVAGMCIILPHRTHGIFTYVYHKNQRNVGKYTIHGSYGLL